MEYVRANLLSILVEEFDNVFGLPLLLPDLLADLGIKVFIDVEDLGGPEERAALDPDDGGRSKRHCDPPSSSFGRWRGPRGSGAGGGEGGVREEIDVSDRRRDISLHEYSDTSQITTKTEVGEVQLQEDLLKPETVHCPARKGPPGETPDERERRTRNGRTARKRNNDREFAT